jgi:hypothetical protein
MVELRHEDFAGKFTPSGEMMAPQSCSPFLSYPKPAPPDEAVRSIDPRSILFAVIAALAGTLLAAAFS